MYNQTECSTEQGINNREIVSIIISACSFLTAIGTFAYFKISSKFKDLQHSEVEIKTSQNEKNNETSITVKFVNDENFEISAKSKKNGGDRNSESILDKMTDKLLSISSSENNSKSTADIESSDILINNFTNAISNNNLGDQIIADTRKGLILHALNTFLKTVKIYNVSEDEVMVISNNNSKAPSIANNLLYHKENTHSIDEAEDNEYIKESIISAFHNKNGSHNKDKNDKSNNIEELSHKKLINVIASTKSPMVINSIPDNKTSQSSLLSSNPVFSKSDTLLKYDNLNTKIKITDGISITKSPKSKSFNNAKIQNLNEDLNFNTKKNTIINEDIGESSKKFIVNWQGFDIMEPDKTIRELDEINIQITGKADESVISEGY